tara:strand:- start:2193 stop:2459 length:267 start_codon:yes stop_codon:yes gene_type:complete
MKSTKEWFKEIEAYFVNEHENTKIAFSKFITKVREEMKNEIIESIMHSIPLIYYKELPYIDVRKTVKKIDSIDTTCHREEYSLKERLK